MNETEQNIRQQTYTHTHTTITYKDQQRQIEYRIQTRLDLAPKGPNTHISRPTTSISNTHLNTMQYNLPPRMQNKIADNKNNTEQTHTLNKNSLQADFTNTPQYASQIQHMLYNTNKSLTHTQKTQRHIRGDMNVNPLNILKQLPQTSTTCTLTYSQPVNRGIVIKPYKQTLPHIAHNQVKNKQANIQNNNSRQPRNNIDPTNTLKQLQICILQNKQLQHTYIRNTQDPFPNYRNHQFPKQNLPANTPKGTTITQYLIKYFTIILQLTIARIQHTLGLNFKHRKLP